MMKSASMFAISMAAASATAANAFSSATKSPYQMVHPLQDGEASKQIQRDYSSEKFAPTFDGLRFIETLVTAHR